MSDEMDTQQSREERDERGRFGSGTSVGADTRFGPGNRAALKAGVRAFEARGDAALPVDLRQTVAEFKSQVIADRGGVAEMTAIEGAYVQRLTELEVCVRLLAADLSKNGLFTPRGRVRNSYGRLLETLDRWDRYATRVGTGRREKQVSPIEAVRLAVEEANR